MVSAPVKDIVIFIFYGEESYEIQTYTNEYRSLMMLIYDKIYTEGFGECLGMGKCGTCLVEIISSFGGLSYYERNENMTLLRAGHTDKNIRLSCQILVDRHLDGLKVKVLPLK
ncbi:MAG: (2Fe-2S)-binding protein [Sphingobacteriaceae bacterium]|nr:MAG: (2Fe-2S)-binding protein [Sphingobacteriaceae bacterium]